MGFLTVIKRRYAITAASRQYTNESLLNTCNTKDQDSVYKAWEAQIYTRNAIQNPFFSKIGCATYKYYWVCTFAY